MRGSAHRWGGLLALAGVEVWLAREYVVRGTTWHLLLHSTLGLAAGLVVAAAAVAVHRPARPGWAALSCAVVGQAVSVLPDLLFAVGQVPHGRWMDAFLAHISIHLVAQPLGVSVAAFLLAGWGWWLAAHGGARRGGALLAAAAVAVVAAALATAHPLPTRLADYARLDSGLATAGWCGPHTARDLPSRDTP